MDSRKSHAGSRLHVARDSLQKLPFFKGCKATFLERLAECVQARFVDAEGVLGVEGDDETELILLRRGRIKCTRTVGVAEEIFSDGAMIGSPLCLIGRIGWPYSVSAVDFCDVQVLTQKDYRAVANLHAQDAVRVTKALSELMPPTPSSPLGSSATSATFTMSRRSSRLAFATSTSWRDTKELHAEPLMTKAATAKAPHVYFAAGTEEPERRSSMGAAHRRRTAPLPAVQRTKSTGMSARKSAGMAMKSPRARPSHGATSTEASRAARLPSDLSGGDSVDAPGHAKARAKHQRPQRPLAAAPAFFDNEAEALQIWAYVVREDDEASRRELASWLDKIPFLNEMDAFVFERVLPIFKKKAYKRSDTILLQGAPSDMLHVVYAGYADVLVDGDRLTMVGPQSVLGERALANLEADEAPACSATVAVKTAVMVTIAMARADLQALVAQDSVLRRQMEDMYSVKVKGYSDAQLAEMHAFRNSDPAFVRHLEMGAGAKMLKPGETLVSEGERCNSLFVLSKGSVFIMRSGAEQDVQLTVTDHEGAILCPMNGLGLARESRCTVLAAEEGCILQVVSLDAARKACEAFPEQSHALRRFVECVLRFETKLADLGAGERRRPRPSMARRRTDREDASSTDDSSNSGGSGSEVHHTGPIGCHGRRRSQDDDASDPKVISAALRRWTRTAAQAAPGQAPDERDSAPLHVAPPTPELGRSSAASSSKTSAALCAAASAGRKPLLVRTTADAEDADRTSCGIEKVMVLRDLRLVPEFAQSSAALLKHLQTLLEPRLYLPDQVVLRHGEDMDHMFILQRGACKMAVFETQMDPIEGPCIIGGMMSLLTPKVMTTIVSQGASFVGAICKHRLAAILDQHPAERKKWFSHANTVFTELCDSFNERFTSSAEVMKRLVSLPFFHRANADFVQQLAVFVHPALLLPGQAIRQERDDPKIFVLFDGYCHVLVRDTVVSTVSSNMIFGEFEVFGLDAHSSLGGVMTVKTVEFCQVGTVSGKHVLDLLERYPAEWNRFEQLVHTRLEESISKKVASVQIFESMPAQIFPQVCRLLERRLFMPGRAVLQQGSHGESMLIVYSGKAEILFNEYVVSILWPGKAFGQAQMLGLQRYYHASVMPKKTCYMMFLSGKALASVAPGGAERRWLTTLKQRAEATFAAECNVFRRHVREQRQHEDSTALNLQWALAGDGEMARDFVLNVAFFAWRAVTLEKAQRSAGGAAQVSPSTALGQAGMQMFPMSPSGQTGRPLPSSLKNYGPASGVLASARSALGDAAVRPQPGRRAFVRSGRLKAGVEASDAKLLALTCEPPPMHFERAFKKVCLDDDAAGMICTSAWRPRAQTGRFDAWSGMAMPDWLLAVRDEMPKQLMMVKREAHGEYIDATLMSSSLVL